MFLTATMTLAPTATAAGTGVDYARQVHVEGEAIGEMCIDSQVTPHTCVPAVIQYTYDSYETRACDGTYAYTNSIAVGGVPFGEGVDGIGHWMVAFIGGYGVDPPYVLTGLIAGTGSISLDGTAPGAIMTFDGSGPVTGTAVTQPADCADVTLPTLDCLLRPEECDD